MKLEKSKERQGNFGRKRTEYVEGEGREKRTKRILGGGVDRRKEKD